MVWQAVGQSAGSLFHQATEDNYQEILDSSPREEVG